MLAKNTLSWLVYARMGLTIPELRYALAIEEGASELDEENLEEADEIISACAGLVAINKETNKIRLFHYTTQEYFVKALPHTLITHNPNKHH